MPVLVLKVSCNAAILYCRTLGFKVGNNYCYGFAQFLGANFKRGSGHVQIGQFVTILANLLSCRCKFQFKDKKPNCFFFCPFFNLVNFSNNNFNLKKNNNLCLPNPHS